MTWLLLLIPFALLIPIIGDFLYQPGSAYSDLVISHYPNAIFLIQAIRETGTIPLWSDTILSGYPFAANPLSGLWYPPGWLALVFPLPLGFNLVAALHMLAGGIGMYRFMKAEGCGTAASLFAGVAIAALPKTWSHLAAGHLTLVYAVSWTPWLLLAQKRFPQDSTGKRRRFGPAIVFALILLADVRWAAYAGVLWLGYAVWNNWKTGTPSSDPCEPAHQSNLLRFQPLYSTGGRVVAQAALAVLLAAPLLLPLAEYTSLSTRADMSAEDVFELSLSPARLLGFLFPDPGGYAEWIGYPTAAVLLLAVWAAARRKTRHENRFWIAAALGSLVFALGSNIPFLEILANLPGVNLLRVPPRALFLTDICLVVLAARGFDDSVSEERAVKRSTDRLPLLAILSIAEIAILIAAAVTIVERSFSFELIWGAAGLSIITIVMWLQHNSRISAKLFAAILFTGLMLDANVINRLSVEPRSPDRVLAEGKDVVQHLKSQPGPYRVYSPSYSLPQQSIAVHNIKHADGVDPLQLKAYSVFMEQATGVAISGYSVTMPSFPSGNPQTDNKDCRPNPHLLGLLNVRFVAAEFDLDVPGLSLLTRSGTTRLYENKQAMPYAWTHEPSQTGYGTVVPANLIDWTPNRIEVAARGPGRLVLSELVFPGWEATVNGERAEILPVEGVLRGVDLGEGEQNVVFQYRPPLVYAGVVLSLVTMVAMSILKLWN
jgi:hypothetical protein